MSSPMISIIVPVYNVEKYLSTCIESILKQTFADFEVILVNDGSHDKSGTLCDELAKRDNRIRVFHKSNGGVSSARNIGLKNAMGEWVTFVDSDDWISPTFIENLYKPILADSKIEFVQGGCTNYRNNIIAEVEQQYENLVSDNPVYLFNHFRGLTVSKLFRKTVITTNNLKFNEQMCTAEDMAFTLDYILHITKYCFISEVGYFYRYNTTSLTHSKKVKPYNNALSEFKHLFYSVQKYIDKHQINSSDIVFRKKQNASRLFYTLKLLYYTDNDYKERRQHLKNDFTEIERSALIYFNEDFISNVLISIYKIGFIDIFDFLMVTLYMVKNKMKRIFVTK